MTQRHPTRVTLGLAAASVAGMVGQLVLPTGWSNASLALMLAPLGHAAIGHLRRAGRPSGGARRSVASSGR